jgi:hypothetical protein
MKKFNIRKLIFFLAILYATMMAFHASEMLGAGPSFPGPNVLYGDYAPINTTPRLETQANQAIENLHAAARQGTVIQVSSGEAQGLAEAGYTVIAAHHNPGGHGHLMTVSPATPDKAYKDNDPVVSHVGEGTNDIYNASEIYSALPFKYYFDPSQR